MNVERTQTGIPKLDDLLHGGIPKGGITLIAGGPGTGKTVFAAQFLYHGAAQLDEKGIYVCFGESAETLKQYLWTLGWDFDELERQGKMRILDLFATAKENLETVLNIILDETRVFEARRLVIDSVTALALTYEKKIEVRILVSLLQKFLRKMGCTTLLVTETAWGSTGIGAGVEEFIADGIILLETAFDGVEFKRRLAVIKMRATEHDIRYYRFVISPKTGISIIPYPEA